MPPPRRIQGQAARADRSVRAIAEETLEDWLSRAEEAEDRCGLLAIAEPVQTYMDPARQGHPAHLGLLHD